MSLFHVASMAGPPVTPRLRLLGIELPGECPHSVRLIRPGLPEMVVSLDRERSYLVGRGETADLHFSEASISRVHGLLCFVKEGDERGCWVFQDERSQFGCFWLNREVQGELRLGPQLPVALKAGQRVRLGAGESCLEFLAESIEPRDTSGASDATRVLEAQIGAAARHAEPPYY